MCDQARTVAVCWWTELQEIAFSQEIGIGAEVNFTYPSTTSCLPSKPLTQSSRNGERLNIEYVFLFPLNLKNEQIPLIKKKKSKPLVIKEKIEELHSIKNITVGARTVGK